MHSLKGQEMEGWGSVLDGHTTTYKKVCGFITQQNVYRGKLKVEIKGLRVKLRPTICFRRTPTYDILLSYGLVLHVARVAEGRIVYRVWWESPRESAT
jgi:hypothetical protein